MQGQDMQNIISLFAEVVPEEQLAQISVSVLDVGVIGVFTPEDFFVDDDTASRCYKFASDVPGLAFIQHFEDAYSGLKSSAFISS